MKRLRTVSLEPSLITNTKCERRERSTDHILDSPGTHHVTFSTSVCTYIIHTKISCRVQ